MSSRRRDQALQEVMKVERGTSYDSFVSQFGMAARYDQSVRKEGGSAFSVVPPNGCHQGKVAVSYVDDGGILEFHIASFPINHDEDERRSAFIRSI